MNYKSPLIEGSYKISLFVHRYDNISDNLEKSERERLFDEHIDFLVAKKKENYRKLLDECKSITLDSSFKDIKKLIKDDPRYSRYVDFLKIASNTEENFICIDFLFAGIPALNENARSSSMSTSKTASALPNRPSGSF